MKYFDLEKQEILGFKETTNINILDVDDKRNFIDTVEWCIGKNLKAPNASKKLEVLYYFEEGVENGLNLFSNIIPKDTYRTDNARLILDWIHNKIEEIKFRENIGKVKKTETVKLFSN